MSAINLQELLAFLQEHEFLKASQLQQAGRGLTSSQALLDELTSRNWLTTYQANKLVQGNGRDLVLGPYRVLDLIGAGGMGQVFKARHVRMDRIVALKIMPDEYQGNAQALARFDREVRAVSQLSHPNVITVYEVNQEGRRHYFTMEFIDGIDLAKLVQQSGPLPIHQACDYIRQAALGLQHAHEKGLIHRDIKPGNLLVGRSNTGGKPVVKVLDFGLASIETKEQRRTRLTKLGNVLGTVDYISPEQATDARNVDIRSDVFSLGCSLYYLLIGKPPFEDKDGVDRMLVRVVSDAPSVQVSRPEIPVALAGVVTKMLARQPAERYQTPNDVAKALEQFAALKSAPVRDSRSNTVAPQPGRDGKQAGSNTPPERKTALKAGQPPPKPKSSAGFGDASSPKLKPKKKMRSGIPLWMLVAGGAVAISMAAVVMIVVGLMVLDSEKKDNPKDAPIVESANKKKEELPKKEPGQKELIPAADRRAAEWVLSIGGNIEINDKGKESYIKAVGDLPGGTFELNAVNLSDNPKVGDVGLVYFTGCVNLTQLNLSNNPQIGDAGLVYFKDCVNLKQLNLTATNVSDSGLVHFNRCKKLTGLYLQSTQISDAGLVHFKDCKNLTSIALSKSAKVSDAGLAYFKDCKYLTDLALGHTKVDNEGLIYFKDCKNLKSLILGYTKVSDDGLVYLKDCKHLASVFLNDTNVSDTGLVHFKNCMSLMHIDLRGTRVTAAGIAELQAALPKCKIEYSIPESGPVKEPFRVPDTDAAIWVLSVEGTISINEKGKKRVITDVGNLPNGAFELTGVILDSNPKVSDSGLIHFKDCKNLTSLMMNNTNVSDAGLVYFKDCKNLTQLMLLSIKVSDAGLVHFKDCKNLTHLMLPNTNVSDAWLGHLRDCKNLMYLELSNTKVTDAGLIHIKDCRNLRTLSLSGTKASAAGVNELRKALPKCNISPR